MTTAAGTAWTFKPKELGITADTGRLTLPAGWYKGYVKESEIKATQKEGGFYVSIMIEIYEPAFAKGRVVFNNYNVKNDNEVAEKIANGQLYGLMKCMDIEEIKTGTGDLHNKPFLVKLKIKPPQMKKDAAGNATQDIEYDERNEVQAVKHLSEEPKVTMATESAAAPAGFVPPVAAPAAPVAAPPVTAPAAPAFAPAPVAPAAPTQPWEAPAAPAAPAPAAPAAVAAPAKAPWEK